MLEVMLRKVRHKIYSYCRLCGYLRDFVSRNKKAAEIRCFVKALRNHVLRDVCKRITIVFDNKASPPTYGDFIYVILLARYLIARGCKVYFVIVQGEYRSDWAPMEVREREDFECEQYRIAKALLSGGGVSIAIMTWRQFSLSYRTRGGQLTAFDRQIKKRKPIYHYCFDVLNQLLSSESSDVISKTLFLPPEEEVAERVSKNKVYVAYGVRYSTKWELHRNTEDGEFVYVVTLLAKLYPGRLIVVISNRDGCEHFRRIAPSNIPIVFSKDVSDDFLSDANLVINATQYIQLRGGGLSLFRIYSLSPYCISLALGNESRWSDLKLTPWQTIEQKFHAIEASSQPLHDLLIDLAEVRGGN